VIFDNRVEFVCGVGPGRLAVSGEPRPGRPGGNSRPVEDDEFVRTRFAGENRRVSDPRETGGADTLLKGLILAQNERWRRGLGMQVARIPRKGGKWRTGQECAGDLSGGRA
jgi:hypothetical protein